MTEHKSLQMWHKSLQLCLRISLLIGLALATILASRILPVAGLSSTPTYVLGVSNPTDPLIIDLQNLTSSITILSSVSSLSLLGPNSILFVDGSWLQSTSSIDPTVLSLVIATVLNGVPTVVVRGNPAILQNAISGLLKFGAPSLPLIAAGVKVISTLPDGTRQGAVLQVAAGFDYAVNTEFTWAQQHLLNASTLTVSPTLSTNGKSSASFLPSATTGSSTGPFWQFALNLTFDTGNNFMPMARIISTWTVFRLQNSGSSTFQWYDFFANQTLLPGIEIYNSAWRNFQEQDVIDVNAPNNTIVSHGPTSLNTSGPTVVTYSIGVTANTLNATVTASQTQSYMLKNTNVTDSSQPLEVGWIHSISSRTSSGMLTFKIIPGWTDRVLTSSCSSKGIDLHSTFTSTFVTLSGGTTTNSASTGVSLVASGC